MSDKCKNCGATIEYTAGLQSLKCPYCDTVNEIKKAEDELPDKVDYIIPLSVTVDDLEKRAYEYMASGDFTPDDMLESATFIKRECFYVPAYFFKIDYQATWTASFGYDRQDANKTVTDWRPSNGIDSGDFTISTYAGGKLLESDLAPNNLLPTAVLNGNPTRFNDSFMKGVEAEQFTVPDGSSFASVKDEINANIDVRVKTHSQGNHQQNWHWNAKINHSTNTIYVPICHAVFDYQGTDYHFWIDGIGSREVRATILPQDEGRMVSAGLGVVPAIVASIGFIAAWYFWGLPSVVYGGGPMFLVGAAWMYSSARARAINSYSKNIRDSLLTQIQPSASPMKNTTAEEQEKIVRAFQRPKRPLLAKTDQDKIVLPILSIAVLLGVLIPLYLGSPEYVYSVESRQAISLETRALQGDADSQNMIGVHYENGRGVPKNAAEAVRWYRKAAEQGNASAQNNLGLMYGNGEGVPEDAVEAVRWYRKAADQGDAKAQYNLSIMYKYGAGVPKDAAEAVRWHRMAAERGHANAQYRLGKMYSKGQGVPQDDTEAVYWYRRLYQNQNSGWPGKLRAAFALAKLGVSP